MKKEKIKRIKEPWTKQNFIPRIKRIFFGMKGNDGILFKIAVYTLLIIIGFIFLYPIIFMIITSLKSVGDLADKSIKWIPSALEFKNYVDAFKQLNYLDSLWKTLLVTILPSLLNTLVASITAYGFAKFNFPGKKALFGIMLSTFIIPKALISIPQFAWYSQIGLLGSLWTYVLPSSLGQGLYFALYFLIMYSTIKQIPKQLEESAKIDGAKSIQIFVRIILPLIIPSMITVFLFSLVWYWNDVTSAAMYLGQAGKDFWSTIPLNLQKYQEYIYSITLGGVQSVLYDGIRMACTLLSIIPLLIIYFSLQRYFVESIEKSGITGE